MSVAHLTKGHIPALQEAERKQVIAEDLLRTCLSIIIAMMVLGLPIFAHTISPIGGIVLALAMTAILANYAPQFAIATIFFAIVFQNTFVSLASPFIGSVTEFNIIRGYSFVILSAAWGVFILTYLTRWRGDKPILDRMMNMTLALFAVIMLYFLIGFVQNPLGSVIYMRNIAGGLMLFQAALLIFSRYPFRVSNVLGAITLLVLICGYLELFFRDEWLFITNGKGFWDLSTFNERTSGVWDKNAREFGVVVKGFADTVTVDLFNTPLLSDLDITVKRLLGPNIHAISYAYLVSFLLTFTLFRGKFITAAALFPLLIFANAKGALILFILVICAWIASRLFGMAMAVASLLAVLTVYIIAGIIVGLNIGDFHVLGFMGGVYNFLGNPIGHGIGSGGNLSTNFSTLDWGEYQALGRTPIAVESAVGVMMFQMGVGTFFFVGTCFWIAWTTLKLARATGYSIHAAAGFSLLVILVNGIFQEEALFSPLALGLIMALNGIIIGAAIRTGTLHE